MAKTKQPTAVAPPPADYTVLARRYRPQQFTDLVGQEPVARALINALKGNRVAHAYLFTGARGVGKTSTARILAKALNCAKGPTPTPCDECDICKSITSGDDIDVLEIDGASNRGIDEVREVRSNVQYRPQRARFKIYIIDEVHMLTAPAFNALLKTLEEPPPHVKFIFATTEVQKIPVTILSRCQRFDFGGISTSRIVERLRDVVKSEKLTADDDALELVARRAGGSMRDAQSLLDQLLAFGGERLTVEQVHEMLGTAGDDRVLELAAAILERQPARALELVGAAAEHGLQLGELIDQLIAYWRDLMLLQSAGDAAPELSVPSRHRETLSRQSVALSPDTVLAGLDILAATKDRARRSNHPRVLLEMAVVRLGRLDDLVSLSQVAQMLASGQVGLRPAAAASPTPRPTLAPPEGVKKKALTGSNGPSESAPTPLTEQSLPAVWQEVLDQMPPMFRSELEKAGPPAISGPNTLALLFAPRYNAARQYCQEPSRVSRIEGSLRKITGQPCQLRIDSGSAGEAATDGEPPGEDVESLPPRVRKPTAEAISDPLVKRAVDHLGAQIIHKDEGYGSAPSRPPPDESAESEE